MKTSKRLLNLVLFKKVVRAAHFLSKELFAQFDSFQKNWTVRFDSQELFRQFDSIQKNCSHQFDSIQKNCSHQFDSIQKNCSHQFDSIQKNCSHQFDSTQKNCSNSSILFKRTVQQVLLLERAELVSLNCYRPRSITPKSVAEEHTAESGIYLKQWRKTLSKKCIIQKIKTLY
jgi:hypothetical protein